MAIKLKHSDTFSTYFVTFTCVEWISLFDITNTYELVYQWFHLLKKEHNAAIVAYVIMPNHLHIILNFHNEHFNLNAIIANGKRFMAYEMIKRLKDSGNTLLLNHLEKLVSAREKQKGQLHKVFKDSFDAKPIITQKFLLQKINYIHNNPVSGKWMLVKDPIAIGFIEYEHSSASFYEIQLARRYTPMHYLDL